MSVMIKLTHTVRSVQTAMNVHNSGVSCVMLDDENCYYIYKSLLHPQSTLLHTVNQYSIHCACMHTRVKSTRNCNCVLYMDLSVLIAVLYTLLLLHSQRKSSMFCLQWTNQSTVHRILCEARPPCPNSTPSLSPHEL